MADFGIGVPDEIARLSLDQEAVLPPPPPPPPLANTKSSGVIAVDITAKFAEAVQTLAPGELVKDGFFTLFESVAALEIMDPKMDSGCVQSEEDLEELYDVSQLLLPEQVLGIIDQLLCHEMAWHLGYPLSQTLFTSVYVESLLMPTPRNIQQADFVRDMPGDSSQDPMLTILRAYCLGMLKACGYVNERIRSEHFYEEEDFVTNTYNRNLLADIPTEAVRETLLEAQKLVSSLSDKLSDDICQALNRRLKLRFFFLDATECLQHIKEPELARKPWEEAIALLPGIKASHELGKAVDESFSAKLQRKLASTMPPRPIVQLRFEDAFGHLSRLFKDGSELLGVLNYTDSQCLLKFVCSFQAKKPQPLVYARTLLQTFLFNEMEFLGSMSIRQIMDDDFSIVTMPANPRLDRDNDEIEAVQDPRFTMSQQMELFRQKAAQPFLDVLRTFCQNRCRVRRTLCHIIRDWENLQVDAEEIDQLIQVRIKERPVVQASPVDRSPIESYSLPLSSWTYLYKLQMMEWIVQLGFELEVYQPDEFAGMYWYLNYLAKWRLQHIERIQMFIRQRAEEASNPLQPADPAVVRQLERSETFIRLSMLDSIVTWELSDSLSCLYTVLARLDLVKAPPRPYSNNELRYELRMRPFASVGLPALPDYEVFVAGTEQPEVSTSDILQYAEKAVAGARRGFERFVSRNFTAHDAFSVGSHERWVATSKNGLKSCIATGIAISAVQKALEKSLTTGELKIKAEVPTPDKSYHDWWVVPRITPIP
ncbi:Mak10 subunit, NatC N-terminal acetyltransferase-domain-containing protein [Dactylonectria macrodidyma]|uniref:Mak10 subunit, NatC N-terminal acetyltransferase-domain-containing protein n=1 Tax=Dactylonectria macrodidyma TaxID=307937 RepID=A0A9P9F9U8_9HYPO|nr:Mak10 subunit, NatC N-terminal acetyltransferase-domain-containing protein [Dactylonectria macrodidyma]